MSYFFLIIFKYITNIKRGRIAFLPLKINLLLFFKNIYIAYAYIIWIFILSNLFSSLIGYLLGIILNTLLIFSFLMGA